MNTHDITTWHNNLPQGIREHLIKDRLFTDEIINTMQIGWCNFNNKSWIVFPVFDKQHNPLFVKLKRPPNAPDDQYKGMTHPNGSEVTVYPSPLLTQIQGFLVVCEGEPDCLALWSQGIPAMTGTHGCQTFREEWLQNIPQECTVLLAYDKDEAGKKAQEKVASLLHVVRPDIKLFVANFPAMIGKDVTDYLKDPTYHGTAEEKLRRIMIAYIPPKEKEVVKKFTAWNDLVHRSMDEYESMVVADLCKFHIAPLDDMFGCIQKTELVVVGADTGVGKSDIIFRMGLENARAGKRVMYFQLEMDEGEVVHRRIMQVANQNVGSEYITAKNYRMKNLTPNQFAAVRAARATVASETNENLQVYTGGALDFKEFLLHIDSEDADGVDMVILDHLHYFAMDGESDSMATNLSEVMRQIRSIVKERKVPIILASHLRKREMFKEPELVDLHGSGDIAKEATIVLLMQRVMEFAKEEDDGDKKGKKAQTSGRPTNMTKIFIRKSRGIGDLGQEPITMKYDTVKRKLVSMGGHKAEGEQIDLNQIF